MVYRGPPSKACPLCRTRRIKCDLVKPSCSQCSRAGKACGGYRDQLDLKFRDESKDVACKVRIAKEKTKKGPTPHLKSATATTALTLSHNRHLMAPNRLLEKATPLLPPLYTTAHDQAVCFFFKTYLHEPVESSRSVYNYLPTLCSNDVSQPALSSIITAIGLAGLSGYWKAPALMSAAGQEYDSALQSINVALYDPVSARSDQTLITVLLMGLYETSTCQTFESMRAWLKHIHGAAALLELRGEQQLLTELGYRLFGQLRGQIYSFCIQKRIQVPESILTLSALGNFRVTDEVDIIANRMAAITATFCDLRAQLASPNDFCAPSGSSTILAQALAIAADLEQLQADLPSSLLYSTLTLPHPAHYHFYPNHFTAMIHNSYRVISILVHATIISLLDPSHPNRHTRSSPVLDPHHAPLAHESKSRILAHVEAICASVPYHLQPLPSPSQKTGSSTRLPPCAAATAILMRLFVAGDTPVCPDDTRKWIISQLRMIGEEMGIRQATTWAGIVKGGLEVTDLVGGPDWVVDEVVDEVWRVGEGESWQTGVCDGWAVGEESYDLFVS